MKKHPLSTKVITFAVLILVLIMIFPYASTPLVSQSIFSEEERAWIASNPVIKVAPDPDYAPVEFYEDSRFQGIAIDFLTEAGVMYGLNFQFLPYSDWTAVLQAAESKSVDMISAAVATDKRSTYLNFTDVYLEMPTQVFKRQDQPRFNSLSGLKGKRIASIKGYPTQEYLMMIVPEVDIVLVQDIKEGLTRLSLGEVDGFVGDVGQVGYYLSALNIGNVVLDDSVTFTFPFNLSIGVIKDEPVLYGIMQKVIQNFPSYRMDAIKRQWLKESWYNDGMQRELISLIGLSVGLSAVLVLGMWAWNYSLKRQVAQKTVDLQRQLEKGKVLQNQLRILIDTIPFPMFTKDASFRFLTVNKAYADFFGLAISDIEGTSDHLIYQKNPNTPLARYRVLEEQVMATKEPAAIENYQLTNRDGKTLTYNMVKVPFPLDSEGQWGILAIAVDITDRVAKEELRVDSLNRLVTNIATQINTPLGNIISSLSYLMRSHQEFLTEKNTGLTHEDLDRYLETVDNVTSISVNGMNRISEIMSSFGSLALLQHSDTKDRVNIYDLLSIIMANRKSRADFTYVLHLPTDQVVTTCGQALEEVLSRVIDNAIEHAFNEDPTTTLTRENRIDVYYEDLGEMHQIIILDNGIGIRQGDELAFALEPLYSTTSHLGNLGIGLSIASSLTREILKGHLVLQNSSEGGLEVRITIKKQT